MSTHPELGDLYELYLLGALDGPPGSEDAVQRDLIRSHRAAGCAECSVQLQRAHTVIAGLGLAAPDAVPGARVKRALLAQLAPGKSRGLHFGFVTAWTLVLGLALTAAWLWQRSTGFEQQSANLEAQRNQTQVALRQAEREAAHLRAVTAIIGSTATKALAVKSTSSAPPFGQAFINRQRGVVLIAGNLAPAGADQIYELWILPKTGAPVAAGTFQTDSSGAVVHAYNGPISEDVAGVAVTLEPGKGGTAPKGPIVMVAKFANGA